MSEVQTQRTQIEYAFRTKDGYKRPTVEVEVPVPTKEGFITLLNSEDKKVVDLLEDALRGLITTHVRSYVDSDTEFDQAKLDALVADGKVSIEAIANLPKSERNTITKEALEEFAKDYITLMPEVTGKTEKQVSAAAGLFMERFKRVAGDTKILQVLQEQLGVFAEKAPEDVLLKNERVVTYLAGKLEELLSLEITADSL